MRRHAPGAYSLLRHMMVLRARAPLFLLCCGLLARAQQRRVRAPHIDTDDVVLPSISPYNENSCDSVRIIMMIIVFSVTYIGDVLMMLSDVYSMA